MANPPSPIILFISPKFFLLHLRQWLPERHQAISRCSRARPAINVSGCGQRLLQEAQNWRSLGSAVRGRAVVSQPSPIRSWSTRAQVHPLRLLTELGVQKCCTVRFCLALTLVSPVLPTLPQACTKTILGMSWAWGDQSWKEGQETSKD